MREPSVRASLLDEYEPRRKFTLTKGVFIFFLIQGIIAFVKLVLSGMWYHWPGFFFCSLAICTSFLSIFALWKGISVPKDRYTVARVVYGLWIALNVILTLWIIFLFIIQVAEWDKKVTEFPKACKLTTNCSRVTSNSTNVRAEGLKCPIVNTTEEDLTHHIEKWIASFPQTDILYSKHNFVHARFVSFWFGFADDFYVQLVCDSESVVVWSQAEARLGTSDYGVNDRRIRDFINNINQSIFTFGHCGQ